MPERPGVVIVDYGMGNLFSVQRACAHAGLDARLSSEKRDLLAAEGAILPGVGAFGSAMEALERLDLASPLRDFAASGRPLFGICLGLQLLMSESEEFGRHKGLDLVRGAVRRLPGTGPDGRRVKVPQVGWNRLTRPAGAAPDAWQASPLRGIDERETFYFVHSYYVAPESPGTVLSLTDYAGHEYCSSLRAGNVFACQFHPEKSARTGLGIYRAWAADLAAVRSAR